MTPKASLLLDIAEGVAMRKMPTGETLALAGATVLSLTSFLPYWASIEPQASDSLVSLRGPTRFSVWDAYPVVVRVGVGLSFVIVALGIARLVARRPSIAPGYLYAAAGAVITVLLVYGVWEGPRGLFDDPFVLSRVVSGTGSVSFSIQRGPLLYVGLAAAPIITVGGLLAHRSGSAPELGLEMG